MMPRGKSLGPALETQSDPHIQGDDMSSLTAIGYAGQHCDAVSMAYPLGDGYRHYASGIMRFTAPDDRSPFEKGGINPYAYCQGDPINFCDPSGHSIWSAIGHLFSDALNYASGFLEMGAGGIELLAFDPQGIASGFAGFTMIDSSVAEDLFHAHKFSSELADVSIVAAVAGGVGEFAVGSLMRAGKAATRMFGEGAAAASEDVWEVTPRLERAAADEHGLPGEGEVDGEGTRSAEPNEHGARHSLMSRFNQAREDQRSKPWVRAARRAGPRLRGVGMAASFGAGGMQMFVPPESGDALPAVPNTTQSNTPASPASPYSTGGQRLVVSGSPDGRDRPAYYDSPYGKHYGRSR